MRFLPQNHLKQLSSCPGLPPSTSHIQYVHFLYQTFRHDTQQSCTQQLLMELNDRESPSQPRITGMACVARFCAYILVGWCNNCQTKPNQPHWVAFVQFLGDFTLVQFWFQDSKTRPPIKPTYSQKHIWFLALFFLFIYLIMSFWFNLCNVSCQPTFFSQLARFSFKFKISK